MALSTPAITYDELLREKGVDPEKSRIKTTITKGHLLQISQKLVYWEPIARLLGISVCDIENITANNRRLEEQKCKMLEYWKEKYGSRATYETLVKALLELNRATTAEMVVDLISSTEPPDTGIARPTFDITPIPGIARPTFDITPILQKLEEDFYQLVKDVETVLEDKNVKLRLITRRFSMLPQSIKRRLNENDKRYTEIKHRILDSSTIKKLFDNLTDLKHWNFMMPDTLAHIIKDIDIPDIHTRIEEYNEKLLTFKMNTKLADLLGIRFPIPDYCIELSEKVEGWEDKTILEAEGAICTAIHPKMSFRLTSVYPGSMKLGFVLLKAVNHISLDNISMSLAAGIYTGVISIELEGDVLYHGGDPELQNLHGGHLTSNCPKALYLSTSNKKTSTGIESKSTSCVTENPCTSQKILQWVSSHGGISTDHEYHVSDGGQVSETLSTIFFFNSEDYQRFHSLSPIPPSLNASPFLPMTCVNLTVNPSAGEPVTVYMNKQHFDLNLEEHSLVPVNKARTQYIAVQRKSIQESVCHDHIEIDDMYDLKSVATNTQPEVIQHNFPQQVSCYPLQTEVSSSQELRLQETGTDYSSFKFSIDSSSINILRRHAYQHSLEVFLPRRHISSDVVLSSFSRAPQDGAPSHPRIHSYQVVYAKPGSILSRIMLPRSTQRASGTNLQPKGKASNQLPRTTSHHHRRQHSRCRDIARDCAAVRLTQPPFDSKEVTQLLHASDYSKIVQQVGNPSTSLRPDSYIPSHFIVGVVYFKMTRYSEAREHFKKCESVAKEAGRDGDVMVCNAYLGDIEYASQNYTKAAQFYKIAIAHHAPGNVALMFKLTAPSLSAVNAKLASSYRNASMMVQAIQHYKTAIREALSDRDRLSAHTSLGNLYQSMGDNSNALEQYKESIQLAEKLSDYISLGWAYGNIGNAYLGLNRKDEAVYHLQKSLDLAMEYERTPQAIGRAYNNLGTAYQAIGDLDKAEEFYDLALGQAINR